MKTSCFSAWAAVGLLFSTLAFSACDAKRDMDSGNGPDSSSTTDLPTDRKSDAASDATATDTSMMSADTTSAMK